LKVCLATVHLNPAFTPLALLYLKAFLVERRGHPFEDVAVVELPRDADCDQVVDRILQEGPELVGLSCYVWNVKVLMTVAERIKQLRPEVTIVVGGPEVGPRARAVLEAHAAIDIVVKAEGEIPLGDIVEALANQRDVGDVKGIWHRADGQPVDSGEADILTDLNYVPSPHLAKYGDYSGRIICLETQRGCVFRCNFCFYNKDFSIRNRRFDLDRVKDEILHWLGQDVHEIYLMDPVFNLNATRAKEILRFLIEHNHRGTKVHAEIWAEFVDEEMAQLFQDANFQLLEVGLQTTDEAVLMTVERRLRLRRFVEGVGHLRAAGLKFQLQLIYGLPGETIESFKRSLNFAVSLDPWMLAVFPLMVLPGTELWRKAEALGLNFDDEPPYHIRSHATMDAVAIAHGWDVVGALRYLGESRTARILSKEPGVTFADVVDEWIASRRGAPPIDPSEGREAVEQFLVSFCARRGIPDAFYRASLRRERSVWDPDPAALPA
jgi:radical SAM superfamily enzyme YgiQ (UPF0313 family)